MPYYVALINWTDNGVKAAHDTVNRYQKAQSAFESLGVRFQQILWTMGQYDIVAIMEAPDQKAVTTALLRLAREGNVRSETLPAFDEQEMQGIVEQLR